MWLVAAEKHGDDSPPATDTGGGDGGGGDGGGPAEIVSPDAETTTLQRRGEDNVG